MLLATTQQALRTETVGKQQLTGVVLYLLRLMHELTIAIGGLEEI